MKALIIAGIARDNGARWHKLVGPLSDTEKMRRSEAMLERERLYRPHPRLFAMWVGHDGLRIGRTDCMIQMMCDLGLPTSA